MKYMLDTNICIYYINQKHQRIAENVRGHLHNGICISVITLAELEHGVAKSAQPDSNADRLRQFLSIFDVLDFDTAAASCYGIIRANLERAGRPIGPLDMQIAAHAKSEGLVLVTNNVKEFERIEGLKLENWA